MGLEKTPRGNGVRLIHAPVDSLGAPGRWMRRKLLSLILDGTTVLILIQKHRTAWLNVLMNFFAFLGTEDFYVLLVTTFLWVLDAQLGKKLGFLMAAAFYLAGAVKNALVLPRPPVPPIIPLKPDTDWGMPSHHTLLAVNMPWYIWFHAYQHYDMHPLVTVSLFLVLASWSFSVMISRLYLGVHSPADVVMGGILGCLLLSVWLQVDTIVLASIALSQNFVAAVIIVVIILLLFHPDPVPLTMTYDESVTLGGIAVGFSFGHLFAVNKVAYSVIDRFGSSSYPWIACVSLIRIAVGLGLFLLTKTTLHYTLSRLGTLVCHTIGLNAVCVERKKLVHDNFPYYNEKFRLPDGNEKDDHQSLTAFNAYNVMLLGQSNEPVNIAIPVKFTVYSALGWLAIYLLPLLFHSCGV